MQSGSSLVLDCAAGLGEFSIIGELSIEDELTFSLKTGNSPLESNSVLLYVSDGVVGWNADKITLVHRMINT